MMRRMMSARIHEVPVAPPIDPVGREPLPKPGEAVDALVAARRPPALEQQHELRRMRVEAREELVAQPPDHRCLDVVIEVEVVDEPRRLDGAEPQQRVDASLGGVQYLHEVLGAIRPSRSATTALTRRSLAVIHAASDASTPLIPSIAAATTV